MPEENPEIKVTKEEMQKALPLIMELINNPDFVNKLQQEGYAFNGEVIFKAFVEAVYGKS